MFSYISCGHGCFFSDLRDKAEYHSPNVPLGPMQVSMARAKYLIIGGWCDLWVKPEKRVQSVRVRGVISTFSWGPKFFYIFQCHRTNWKKQHFICSNLTLFIVPFFFLSFFLFSFSFFFFSFFFFFFFLISVYLRGATAPSPHKCRLWSEYQGRSQRRVDSICEGYQIRECTASEYQGRSWRRGCDVCMCGCTWPEVQDPKWEKLYTEGEAKERIIMGSRAPGYHGRSSSRRHEGTEFQERSQR